MEEKKKRGRPPRKIYKDPEKDEITIYDFCPQKRDLILSEISNGKSLTKVINENRGVLPSFAVIIKWMNENPSFRVEYEAARDVRADKIFDEMIDLVDESGDIPKARLQVDTRKWCLGRMKPRSYDERHYEKEERDYSQDDLVKGILSLLASKYQPVDE